MCTPLVFAHANSFPAGTYRLLFDKLHQSGYDIAAVDKFGHLPQYPVTDQWPGLVGQLHDFAAQVRNERGERPYLVGHSLGGILSLMTAALHPQIVRGVVLLDSPVVVGWRARALHMAKRTSFLRQRFMPSAVSAKRRTQWESREHALSHFASKRVFARWDQRVLHDYVQAGLQNAGQGVTLSFTREIETRIYDTLPHSLGQLLRQHPVQCPVAFIGGTRSRELRQAGLAGIRRLPQVEIRMIDGTHLFPMEKPLETAELLVELLDSMREKPQSSAPANLRP